MNKIKRDLRRTASVVLLATISVLFIISFFRISAAIRQRSYSRMQEGVQTVINEVSSKLMRDSRILNATAKVLSSADNFDVESMREIIGNISPLLETTKVRILMPDNRILTPDGNVTDASEAVNLSYEKEVALGEHISGRVVNAASGIASIRHFVPIEKDGEIVALLYGVTRLNELPDSLNISNIYNSSADVFMIDTETGDFLLDTMHDKLGNIDDYSANDPDRKTKGNVSWEKYTQQLVGLKSGYVVFRSNNTDGWECMNFAPAGINKWAIAVAVPEKEAFTSVYAVRNVYIVIGSLMLISIALYYMFINRQTKKMVSHAVERAVLEEKLKKAEAAERAKTTFLSNMSHDIRTPMNAIIGFTTLAETNIDNKERVREYLTKILSSSNHLLSLINDILDMSRIESGKLNIEEKPCSLSDIFKDMRNIIQTQMNSKQLNFFMDTMDVVDEDIYCDKLHVNQVLLNLLSNAIKFTSPGGSVSLTVQQKSGAPKGYGNYEIRVKDTGIGMSEEFAEHIFEPFERERTSTVSGIQGTGLGMAITKNIVDTMGGSIEVKTQQGKGTEFIVNLQLKLQNETKQASVIRELSGVRGLVVDDNFQTCDSVTKMLAQIGMRAEWSMHGKEAVLRARQAVEMDDEFYAYIIDWALPDLSGIEVARQLRTIVGKHVPIVILTAYDWTSIEEEAREAGVTAFCNKPIFMSELRETLLYAIGKTELPGKKEEFIPDPVEELKGKRLLLVEDNELNREIAQELLNESGFEVDTAEDGVVAVDKIKNSEPGYYALVLMDVQMPNMNGYEASKAIRALENPALSSIPIVAMTANAFDEDRKKAIESGMNDHVAKPINVNNLLQVLITQLSESKDASENAAESDADNR